MDPEQEGCCHADHQSAVWHHPPSSTNVNVESIFIAWLLSEETTIYLISDDGSVKVAA